MKIRTAILLVLVTAKLANAATATATLTFTTPAVAFDCESGLVCFHAQGQAWAVEGSYPAGTALTATFTMCSLDDKMSLPDYPQDVYQVCDVTVVPVDMMPVYSLLLK